MVSGTSGQPASAAAHFAQRPFRPPFPCLDMSLLTEMKKALMEMVAQ
jgi:hypothetical protein